MKSSELLKTLNLTRCPENLDHLKVWWPEFEYATRAQSSSAGLYLERSKASHAYLRGAQLVLFKSIYTVVIRNNFA